MSGEGFGHCESKEALETQVLNFPFQTTGCSISLPVKVEGSCVHKSARFYIPKGRDRGGSKCFPIALCRQSQVTDRCHVRIFFLFKLRMNSFPLLIFPFPGWGLIHVAITPC